MARAIDSEAAYRFLSEQLVKETGAFSKGVNKGLNIARSAMRNPDAIPTLTPPNEWASVEERLPEGHVQVLMWSAKWNIAEAGSYYNKRFWVYSEIGDGYIAENITHWMPLPAPPGKDNNVSTKEQNEPLTIEQLREMKDEPAYLKVFDPSLQSAWHIIKAVTTDKIIFRGWQTAYVPVSGMGVDYNLYRRPPERQEDTDA